MAALNPSIDSVESASKLHNAHTAPVNHTSRLRLHNATLPTYLYALHLRRELPPTPPPPHMVDPACRFRPCVLSCLKFLSMSRLKRCRDRANAQTARPPR